MKLSTLFMIMVALQFTLVMFGEGISETPLYILVTHPTDWSALGFVSFLGLLAGGILTSVAIVGTLVFGKNDLAVFSGAVAVFIGFCYPVASLWNVINKEVGYFGTEAAPYIASAFCAPLVILSFITIVNWWRSASDIS